MSISLEAKQLINKATIEFEARRDRKDILTAVLQWVAEDGEEARAYAYGQIAYHRWEE